MAASAARAMSDAWARACTWLFARPDRAAWALVLACGAALLPYLVLARYIHPSADDYSFLVRARAPIANYADLYLTRFGRFTSNALVLADPFSWGGLPAYRAAAVLIIVGMAVGLYALFRALLRGAASRAQTAALALATLLLLLFQMPTLAEGVYWYTGAAVYLVPNILFLLYAASLALQLQRQEGGGVRFLHLALNALVLLLLGGFNEGLTMLLVAMHVFGLYKAWRIRSPRVVEWSALALVSLAAFAVMAAAPGNQVRGAVYEGSHDLARSLVFTALQTVRFSTQWISSAPFLVGVLLLFLFVRRVAPGVPLLRDGLHVTRVEAFVGLGAIFVFCVFPAYWFTGAIGQHRTMDTAQFFFLLGTMVNVVAWARDLRTSRLPDRLPAGAAILAAALLVVPAATTHNGYDAGYDLIYGLAQGYDEENLDRYARIADAVEARAPAAEVPPLASRPKTIFVLDATPEPEHWINRAMTDHFGVTVVVNETRAG